MKEWLWIIAVVFVVLFTLALCGLFFSDYTCCPCRRRRWPEFVLPTHDRTPVSAVTQAEHVLPVSPRVPPVIPSAPPRTKPQRYPSPRTQVSPVIPSVPTPAVPSAQHYYALAPTDSPNLHLKHADIPVAKVINIEHGVPVLDLHYMTVREATLTTKKFLHQSLGRYQKVKIITGRGLHTEDGIPRLKPAIINMLNDSNYKFQETSKGGCIEVFLS